VKDSFPKIPILYMTGYTSPEEIPAGSAVLRKPFSRQALSEAVWKVLARSGNANPSLSALTEHWQTHLRKAREEYVVCSTNFHKVLIEQAGRLIHPSDGSLAIHQARIRETAARSEYMRILRIVTDLVVRGKLPESCEANSEGA
jgi:hypothetical protein